MSQERPEVWRKGEKDYLRFCWGQTRRRASFTSRPGSRKGKVKTRGLLAPAGDANPRANNRGISFIAKCRGPLLAKKGQERAERVPLVYALRGAICLTNFLAVLSTAAVACRQMHLYLSPPRSLCRLAAVLLPKPNGQPRLAGLPSLFFSFIPG